MEAKDEKDADERAALAVRIRKWREYLGFSQENIADCLGLHRPSVSMIEAGQRKVSSDELGKLAKVFRIPVAALLGEGSQLDDKTASLVACLDEADRKELLTFAEYLTWRKKA